MYSGIAEPLLVMMRVLSRLGGVAGVLVVVVTDFDGLGAFLETTLAQVFWGGPGGVVVEPEAVTLGGGGEGCRPEGGKVGGLLQDCYLCGEGGYLINKSWVVVEGWWWCGCLAAFWRCLTWVGRVLMS